MSNAIIIAEICGAELLHKPSPFGEQVYSREQLEAMIAKVCEHLNIIQPRMYKHIARSRYLSIAKKKRKTKSQLRRGIRQQPQYVKRDLGYINELVERGERTSHNLI